MEKSEALPVDLRAGETSTVTVKLHKGLSISGTVMGADGQPVAG